MFELAETAEGPKQKLKHNKIHSSCGRLGEQQVQCSAVASAVYSTEEKKEHLKHGGEINLNLICPE